MPIDPSIALQIRPPQFASPFEQAGKAYGLLGLIQRQKLTDLALQEGAQKLAEAQRRREFFSPGNLSKFMTPGQPAIPEASDEAGGGPGRFATAPSIDFRGLLQAGVTAGAIDPLAYLKELKGEYHPIGSGGLLTPSGIIPPVAKPVKDTGTWSEPYQVGGAWVQKNSATGQVRQSVAREPQIHVSQPVPPVVVTDKDGNVRLYDRSGALLKDLGNVGKPSVTRDPRAMQLYGNYANNPQVKAAEDVESKFKPVATYMAQFAKTKQSVNAEDEALAKMYLSVTTPTGSRAYSMDRKELAKLPNLGDRLGNAASSFFAGKDLTDQTRMEMFNVIRGRYTSLAAQRDAVRNMTLNRAKAMGIDESQIFGTQ